MKQDALGNDIVFGSMYGYARNQNGINTINIGRAIKETTHGITLKLVRKRVGGYEKVSDLDIDVITDIINVKSIMLFPVIRNCRCGKVATNHICNDCYTYDVTMGAG